MKPFALIAFISLFINSISNAQEGSFQVNIEDLVNETQFTSSSPDQFRMVWYLPLEYWEAVFAQDPSIDEEGINEIINALKDYELFVVLDGPIGTFGNIKYRDRSAIRQDLKLIDILGEARYSLDDNEISSDANAMLTIMRPIFANMLGAMGENFQFFCFKARQNGERILTPKKKGVATIELAKDSFKFEFPLPSLLPPKFCPIDNKTMKGTWLYCPFHGNKLEKN